MPAINCACYRNCGLHLIVTLADSSLTSGSLVILADMKALLNTCSFVIKLVQTISGTQNGCIKEFGR